MDGKLGEPIIYSRQRYKSVTVKHYNCWHVMKEHKIIFAILKRFDKVYFSTPNSKIAHRSSFYNEVYQRDKLRLIKIRFDDI